MSENGKSLLTLNSRELFPAAYALMLKLMIREKEVLEAVEKIDHWLNAKDVERETGMPDLPSWAMPANEFMPKGGKG